MADENTKIENEAYEVEELEAGDTVESLEAGDDTASIESAEGTFLPAGYEVMVSDAAQVDAEVSQAEEFGETLNSLQNIIQRYSEQQDQVSSKLRDLREMMKSLFDNDAELQELSEQAKAAQQDSKARKQRIKETPESVELQMKMKELKEEQGEIQDTLNNHLLRYYQLTGSQVIEEPDGSEREFKIQARLKAKKAV